MQKYLKQMTSPWVRFSRKLAEKIEKPRFMGSFSSKEALSKNMRLVVGSAEEGKTGFRVIFYWLVDEWDGVIADVKFQAFGSAALLGAAEAVSELLIRKNYDQAQKMQADFIDRHLRDKKDKEAFPEEEYHSLNLVVDAVEVASKQCLDIALPEEYVPTPMQAPIEGKPYPGWDTLSLKQQLAVIEEVISVDVRPYIELDAGGIEIVSLTDGKDLVIAYKGACTTCHSSTGSTLQAIQQILSAKVHPNIRVIPDSSFLGPSMH
ncbi:MAG: NifU family protein [Verrucomicrobia bacterium]|nr:NifU family protein [Verrucomicrobiota bacterium]